jgi:hypothetical protein
VAEETTATIFSSSALVQKLETPLSIALLQKNKIQHGVE